MNRPPDPIHAARSALSVLTLMAFLLTACQLWAQSNGASESQSPPAGASSQPTAQQPPATPNDDLTQMRTDLDRMDSLLGNMSSEIEFLHDQNLQILLRTNAQIWTILIRDMRRQVDREEQQRNRK